MLQPLQALFERVSPKKDLINAEIADCWVPQVLGAGRRAEAATSGAAAGLANSLAQG